jgi:hypothetical protein
MIKIFSKIKSNLFLVLLVFVFPLISFAMSIDVEKPQEDIRVGDVVILNVFINTDGKEINVLDGEIKITGAYEIKSLSTAGSVFNLWPVKPTHSGQTISFVGGTPAGVAGSQLKVFSIALQPLDSQGITFSSENLSIFLNDGSGTRVVAEKMNKNITVLTSSGESKNGLDKIILEDKTLPEEFEILIGKEENLFDGKYFASFYATDNQSGINRYEVLEDGYDWVVSENTYVLRNQNIKGEIAVKAIDNAGNVRIVKSNIEENIFGKKEFNKIYIPLSALLLLLMIYFMYNYLRRKNEKS